MQNEQCNDSETKTVVCVSCNERFDGELPHWVAGIEECPECDAVQWVSSSIPTYLKHSVRFYINQAKSGRPDLAAKNAAMHGRIALARYVGKKYPHSSGVMFSTEYVEACIQQGIEEYQNYC